MRQNGIPVVNTRALGQAFLFGSPRLGQAAAAPTPDATGAMADLEKAAALYKAMKARYEDLIAIMGRAKADIVIGQAADSLVRARDAYRSAAGQGA